MVSCVYKVNNTEVIKMSEREKKIAQELETQIDKLTPEQRERLGLIAQGMALEAERTKGIKKED